MHFTSRKEKLDNQHDKKKAEMPFSFLLQCTLFRYSVKDVSVLRGGVEM